MKILEIDITDFGIVEKATIDFTDKSLVVFSGKNGSGKSTILQALLMNIADAYKGSLSEYVRWGAKEFRVAIKFELHGVIYNSIIVGGTGSSRSLSFGEEVYRNSDAKKKLAELIDPSIFKSVAISSQGQVDLIETTPSERREHLKKVYDLNFVEQLHRLDVEIKELD
jgi:DNA repair exonuclease SbcCD ATPase subunit